MPTTRKTREHAMRAMTPRQVEAAARRDPDNRPLSSADLARMKRTPQVKIIRRALGLNQEDFVPRIIIFRSAPCAIGNKDVRPRTRRRALTLP